MPPPPQKKKTKKKTIQDKNYECRKKGIVALHVYVKLQPRTKLLETNWKHTRIFLLFLIKPLTLLHKYLCSPPPLSSFNVVLKTTGFVWASIMAKTTLYGGGEGSNLYRSCSVQLRRRYWKTGGSVSRVLSKVVGAFNPKSWFQSVGFRINKSQSVKLKIPRQKRFQVTKCLQRIWYKRSLVVNFELVI